LFNSRPLSFPTVRVAPIAGATSSGTRMPVEYVGASPDGGTILDNSGQSTKLWVFSGLPGGVMISEVQGPQRPIPQYTLRTLFIITTGCAVFCSIAAYAMRGYLVALVISVCVGAAVVLMLVGAAFFSLVWILSCLGAVRTAQTRADQPTAAGNDETT
jgi:hypothetical protein